jgi:hypothetical protein
LDFLLGTLVGRFYEIWCFGDPIQGIGRSLLNALRVDSSGNVASLTMEHISHVAPFHCHALALSTCTWLKLRASITLRHLCKDISSGVSLSGIFLDKSKESEDEMQFSGYVLYNSNLYL